MLVVPMCLSNICKYKILVKTQSFIILYNYYLRATCFDSLESSSGPLDRRVLDILR